MNFHQGIKMKTAKLVSLVSINIFTLLSFSVFARDSVLHDRLTDPLEMDDLVSFSYSNKGIDASFGHVFEDNSITKRSILIKGQGINNYNSLNEFNLIYRNYNKKNGYGTNLEISYNFEADNRAEESSEISYGIFKELIQSHNVRVYAEAGLGVKIENNPVDSGDIGYTIPGTYGYTGFYSSFLISERFALEINPFVTYALSGSNSYLENAYGNAHRARVTTDINVKYALSEDMQLKLSSSFELGTPFDESKFSIVFTHFY